MIKRSSITWPIILGIALLAMLVALLVLWIVNQAAEKRWALLTLGTIFILFILVGFVVYLIWNIKEYRLNRRQANFLDSVTHELKSPIASLKLCLQTLEMREVTPAQQSELRKFMLEDIQRLDGLIDHLLTVARLDHLAPAPAAEEVELAPLLAACAEEVRRRYELGNDQLRVTTQACAVYCARRDLEIVFLNLLDNAVKYAGKEPQVQIDAALNSAGKVVVRISDNGTGVRFELRRKIFHRFFRGGSELERTTKGTGLGLYIVRSIVRHMKGTVHVHGRGPLGGATFEVTLPCQPCGAASPGSAGTPAHDASQQAAPTISA
jgi:signal transduction histidine kinase